MHATLLQVRKIIDALPQRHVMKDDDVEHWIQTMWEKEPERIVWHANRLNGWGGSEIGVLVADMLNKENSDFDNSYHSFKSVQEVIKEKLCISIPARDEDENEDDIRRGTIGEPWLIERLIVQLKQTYGDENVQIDKDTMAAMGTMDAPGDHPWLVGNIDLALIVNEKRMIIDIKWPRSSKAGYMAKMTPFTYDCQLKHYELRAEHLKVPIQIDNTVLACFDSDNFKFHLGVVHGEENIKEDILRAGDFYFNNYLLKGIIPEYKKSKTPTATTEILNGAVNDRLNQLHALKVLKRELDAQIDLLEDDISSELDVLKLPPYPKLDFAGGLGSIKGKGAFNYNDDLLRHYAPVYNIKCPSELTDKIRQDIHMAMLSDKRVTENEVMSAVNPTYKFTYPLSRAGKGPIFEKISAIREKASSLLHNNLASINNSEINSDDVSIRGAHAKKLNYCEKKLVTNGDGLTVEDTQNKSNRSKIPVENKNVKPEPLVEENDQNIDEDNDLKHYFSI